MLQYHRERERAELLLSVFGKQPVPLMTPMCEYRVRLSDISTMSASHSSFKQSVLRAKTGPTEQAITTVTPGAHRV